MHAVCCVASCIACAPVAKWGILFLVFSVFFNFALLHNSFLVHISSGVVFLVVLVDSFAKRFSSSRCICSLIDWIVVNIYFEY